MNRLIFIVSILVWCILAWFGGYVYPKDVAKKYIPIKIITSHQDEECLALNIYWESRNQDLIGMVAVGFVTVNRVFSAKFPETICEVVKQHKQFSWYSDGKGDTPKEMLAWDLSKTITHYVLNNYSKNNDPTNGALFYHANYVKPYWASSMKKTRGIGDHFFYKYKS